MKGILGTIFAVVLVVCSALSFTKPIPSKVLGISVTRAATEKFAVRVTNARESGLEVGSVISTINGKKFDSIEQFVAAVDQSVTGFVTVKGPNLVDAIVQLIERSAVRQTGMGDSTIWGAYCVNETYCFGTRSMGIGCHLVYQPSFHCETWYDV